MSQPICLDADARLKLQDAMAIKLVFTKDSPLNTTLVDEASGLVMYEIETGRSFTSKTTVIRKPFTSAPSRPFERRLPPLIAHCQIGEGTLCLTPLPKSRGYNGRRGRLTGSCIMGAI